MPDRRVAKDPTPRFVARSSENRQRFSIAHELGHHLLSHHDRFHMMSLRATHLVMTGKQSERPNEFAADLLMPRDMVTSRFPHIPDTQQLAAMQGFGACNGLPTRKPWPEIAGTNFQVFMSHKRQWAIHLRVNALSSSPDWRRIERKVPRGICLRPAGMITVSVGLPVLRYLTWLPRWETKRNPSRSSVLTISSEE